jgi:HEAT repeats
MSSDEQRGISATGPQIGSVAEARPSDSDVVRALVEIEHASDAAAPPPPVTTPLAPEPPWFARTAPVIAVLMGVVLLALFTAWGLQSLGKKLASTGPVSMNWSPRKSLRVVSSIDASKQAEVETLLQRLASGDASAADEVLSRSSSWTGKTHRTPKTDQFIDADLNSRDMHAREAAIAAQLAVDGVPQDQSGLGMLEQSVGNRSSRAWALWMLGALGNRGIDPAKTTKILGAYLSDPDANVRASAVNGLALVATDETIPMMLDRFRNDPSPLVQERAACGLAESGMYTHQQRMMAAASLVGWIDDPRLTPQQRSWNLHALSDISGQNFGTDAAAWRNWYESSQR